jgi:C4-dicarboxylate-specific signal transduction histidine kinase
VQLQQVILHLIMNAVESMNSVERRVLSFSTALDDSGVRVSVEDSDSRIEPVTLTWAFEPLYTTKARGMRMGLSICHSIIERHSERLWPTAAQVKGSVFQFVVPAGGGQTR